MLNSSRIAWRPLLTATSACAALSLSACQQDAAPETENTAATMNLPSVPVPEPAIDRASLLAAVAEAASTTAGGGELPEALRQLDGRQFEFRIRFGCRGPANDLADQWLGWSFDPEERTLRVRAKPTISMDEPLISGIAGEQFEAVEGFWIPRPWLLQPVCPVGAAVRPAEAAPAAEAPSAQSDGPNSEPERVEDPVPAAPRIGIAQFFTSTDARTQRRDTRPYQAVKTLPEGAPISSQGFNLVLSGRLRALPGRGVIACTARNAQSPPECIVSAEFDRVWMERPADGEVLAEWGSG